MILWNIGLGLLNFSWLSQPAPELQSRGALQRMLNNPLKVSHIWVSALI